MPNGAMVKNLAEQLLLVPRPYTSIVRTLEPIMAEWPPEARFSQHSLARHARRHLNWEAAAFREVADRRAAESGGASDRMLTAGTVFEVVQQRGLELMLQDELRPSVKDLLVATNALREVEQETTEGHSLAHLYSQMDRIITIFREELPEDLRDRIMSRILDEERTAASPPSQDLTWQDLEEELEAEPP
ncbi:MAG: hypothetical protein WEE66_12795 [Actinomycetota bacterium]